MLRALLLTSTIATSEGVNSRTIAVSAFLSSFLAWVARNPTSDPATRTTASVINESLAHFLSIEISIRNGMQISGQCPRAQPRSRLNLTGQPYRCLQV